MCIIKDKYDDMSFGLLDGCINIDHSLNRQVVIYETFNLNANHLLISARILFSTLLFHPDFGNRAGACGGPRLAAGIRESIYLN